MIVAVPAVWAAVVLLGFLRHRPRRRRLPVPGAIRPVERAAARPERERLLRLGLAAVAGAVTAVVLPVATPLAVLGAWAAPVWRARRRQRVAEASLRHSVPEVVDLLALVVGAGATVQQAVAAIGRRHDGMIGVELARADRAIGRGQRCADALADAAARLGPTVRPVLDALLASERYGAPLGDALVRLAADARADRRRQAEEAARRVPVQLLFPLVLCVLPAFALLTVVPLLAGAFGSLRL